MKNYYRTDLACESTSPNTKINGVIVDACSIDGIDVIKTVIKNKNGERATKRKIGTYLTAYCGRVWLYAKNEKAKIAHVIAQNLKNLLLSNNTKPKKILIVGLGNRFITADSLGPCCIDKLYATRHLKNENVKTFSDYKKYEVSLIAPGVTGQTGIEAYEIVNSMAKCVEAECIIAIDSLASKNPDRLCTTVQISNTGIYPGSGIGNFKQEISKTTTGVDVISLGVPTVVDSSALVYSALENACIKDMSKSITELLNNGKSYFVSLKDTDIVIEAMSEIVSNAISIALFDKSEL